MTAALRPDLPPLPARMRHLHVRRGYPVPFFVTWLDNGVEVPRGEGEPDFRIITADTVSQCIADRRCWVCGSRLGQWQSFVVGPMCAVNRTSAEPPSHLECADWSARACPFLTRPHAKRNEKSVTDELGIEDMTPAPGVMLRRNPGVALVWTTRRYLLRADHRGGLLIDIGKPEHVRWYCEGRPATRAEIEHSIDTGLPALLELAEQDGRAGLQALEKAVSTAMELLPA